MRSKLLTQPKHHFKSKVLHLLGLIAIFATKNLALRLSMDSSSMASIHWFRKGLRLHDNPALLEACQRSKHVYPVFCIDPYFVKPDVVGVNRYHFLLESLADLDRSLRGLGSRLFILRGKPNEQILAAKDRWNINLVTYESDTEPYAKARDVAISRALTEGGVEVKTFSTHTLRDPERYIAMSKGKIPNTYQSFLKLFDGCGGVREDVAAPDSVPPPRSTADLDNNAYDIPTLLEMGYTQVPTTSFHGGESEALQRLQTLVTNRPRWVNDFAKPETSPNSLEPSTTVLSPYLKFGCLSPAKFYHEVARINHGKTHTAPPVSLHGQLLWREFFYLQSYATPNFDRMEGNAQCKQIPWERNEAILLAWKEGRTGFPFIDAIMTQLRIEGWIHHLARHAVACFLTRGDLFQHWEEGVRIFDLYLLDDDWALNNANWQWLSCSNFFYQYFRCYSPIAFGKKTDPEGLYIKKWLPQLANIPAKYIYEPWKAPLAIQQKAVCIVGRDYPMPIVEHEVISKVNMNRMKEAYAHQDDGQWENVTVATSNHLSRSVALQGHKAEQGEETEKQEAVAGKKRKASTTDGSGANSNSGSSSGKKTKTVLEMLTSNNVATSSSSK